MQHYAAVLSYLIVRNRMEYHADGDAVSDVFAFLFLSFFIAVRGPAYFWTSALRPCKSNGPVC